ncbi:MAG: hypothetical protein BAJATHORv1_30389 [Candidatus Thorarchaeota archaeon]|nr:MAG: hypothetical protein BAJATHORv1_30389 [Candidatus Thorarchaeota archaeon]
MAKDIFAVMILEEDTGQPLYTYFIDPQLKRNPGLIPQKLRTKEIRMVHVLGKHVVFTALVAPETTGVKEKLEKLRERIEKVFPEGLKRGKGNFADMVILENISQEVLL